MFSNYTAENANTNEICAAASRELGPLYIVLSGIKKKTERKKEKKDYNKTEPSCFLQV